jgi:mRNA interferase RelE/StbE
VTYRITWRPAALRSIDKLDRPVRARILHTIDALATEPRPHGAIALTGGNGDLRVRVGTYRIIYRVNDIELTVLVVSVGHRRDIYR